MSKEGNPRSYEQYPAGKRRVQHAVASAALLGVPAGAGVGVRVNSDQNYGSATRAAVVRELSPQEAVAQQGTIVDFTQKKEKKESSDLLSKEWLQEEVAREKEKPLLSGETPWYHLSGTGFWVKEQVSQLLRNTSKSMGVIAPEVFDLELSKVKVDIEAFEDEYLKQMASLKWNLTFEERDGEQRVVCPDYNNALWSSTTSKNERDGFVYKTLFGNKEKEITGVEGWLKTAPADSFAVIVSPAGWSGLEDADGNAIRYPETQVYAVNKKADGSLQGYTFRYDATIEQNEVLQQKLGLTIPKAENQKERIKNTLANVAFLTPEKADIAEQKGGKSIRHFEDIVDIMQEAVDGRAVAYSEGGELKTFADIKAFLKNVEGFSEHHPLTAPLINRFKEYAHWRFLQSDQTTIEQELQIALAVTVLQLNRLYRDEEKHTEETSGEIRHTMLSTEPSVSRVGSIHGGMNYQKEQEDLRKRPGCAGGGNKTHVTSMGGSRNGESTNKKESTDYEFDHEGECVVCNGGPKLLGPCDICVDCDASLGGKAAKS